MTPKVYGPGVPKRDAWAQFRRACLPLVLPPDPPATQSDLDDLYATVNHAGYRRVDYDTRDPFGRVAVRNGQGLTVEWAVSDQSVEMARVNLHDDGVVPGYVGRIVGAHARAFCSATHPETRSTSGVAQMAVKAATGVRSDDRDDMEPGLLTHVKLTRQAMQAAWDQFRRAVATRDPQLTALLPRLFDMASVQAVAKARPDRLSVQFNAVTDELTISTGGLTSVNQASIALVAQGDQRVAHVEVRATPRMAHAVLQAVTKALMTVPRAMDSLGCEFVGSFQLQQAWEAFRSASGLVAVLPESAPRSEMVASLMSSMDVVLVVSPSSDDPEWFAWKDVRLNDGSSDLPVRVSIKAWADGKATLTLERPSAMAVDDPTLKLARKRLMTALGLGAVPSASARIDDLHRPFTKAEVNALRSAFTDRTPRSVTISYPEAPSDGWSNPHSDVPFELRNPCSEIFTDYAVTPNTKETEMPASTIEKTEAPTTPPSGFMSDPTVEMMVEAIPEAVMTIGAMKASEAMADLGAFVLEEIGGEDAAAFLRTPGGKRVAAVVGPLAAHVGATHGPTSKLSASPMVAKVAKRAFFGNLVVMGNDLLPSPQRIIERFKRTAESVKSAMDAASAIVSAFSGAGMQEDRPSIADADPLVGNTGQTLAAAERLAEGVGRG
jgi:hypothetical protein